MEYIYLVHIILVSYLVGNLFGKYNALAEKSNISFFASMFATVEAFAIKNAPIVRQIVDRYVSAEGKEMDEESLKKMQDKLEKEYAKMYGFTNSHKDRLDKQFRRVDSAIMPEDTV